MNASAEHEIKLHASLDYLREGAWKEDLATSMEGDMKPHLQSLLDGKASCRSSLPLAQDARGVRD